MSFGGTISHTTIVEKEFAHALQKESRLVELTKLKMIPWNLCSEILVVRSGYQHPVCSCSSGLEK